MTNAIQIKNGDESRLVEQIRARGGVVSIPTRTGLLSYGPCVVGFSWAREGSSLIIRYLVPKGCEGFEEGIEEIFVETSRSSDDRAWKTPALVAAIVLAIAVVYWGRK